MIRYFMKDLDLGRPALQHHALVDIALVGDFTSSMVLQRRAADVEALYAADSDPRAVHL